MQDITETAATEADAYGDMYYFFKWNTADADAHDVLKDRLSRGRAAIREKIIRYREERIIARRAHLVRSLEHTHLSLFFSLSLRLCAALHLSTIPPLPRCIPVSVYMPVYQC